MHRSRRVAASHDQTDSQHHGGKRRSGTHSGGQHSGTQDSSSQHSAARRTGSAFGRKRAVALAGTALALASAGTASAAAASIGTSGSPADSPAAPASAATLTGTAINPPVSLQGATLDTLVTPGTPAAAVPHLSGASTDPALLASGKPGHPAPQSRGHRAPHRPAALTWLQIRNKINRETNPAQAARGHLPLADRLIPVGTRGPQAWMQLGPAQLHNATVIVQRALHKKMGIRAAVIAVATAMQESRLENLGYGDASSLGLFQQRPDCGWGTAHQILKPAYAADAFLSALARHQALFPAWVRQPLWANAQAVQKSGFPFAYAKWEVQAANLVKQIAMHQA